MLEKSRRIKKKDFPSRNLHRQYQARLFTMRIYLEGNKETSFATIVSKKTQSNAPKRNKIKRQYYSALRSFVPKVKKGYKVLIYPKKNKESFLFQELFDEIGEALEKTNLFEKN